MQRVQWAIVNGANGSIPNEPNFTTTKSFSPHKQKLIEYSLGGLCNIANDPASKELILSTLGMPNLYKLLAQLSQSNAANSNEESVINCLTLLIYLQSPTPSTTSRACTTSTTGPSSTSSTSRALVTLPAEAKDLVRRLSQHENRRIGNVAAVLTDLLDRSAAL